MKNFLIILFSLSALTLVNSANAFECPDIANNTKSGNIENLNEVDIMNGGGTSNPGTVECQYGSGSNSYTFNYTASVYTPSAPDNWDGIGVGIKCVNSNPDECQFNDYNGENDPSLQKCPDSLTAYNQQVLFSHAFFKIYDSGNTIGNVRCFYPGGSQGIPNFSGLYEYSLVNNLKSNNLWTSYLGYYVCGASTDSCKFYLVNNY